MICTDFYATILHMLEVQPAVKGDDGVDGMSIVPLREE